MKGKIERVVKKATVICYSLNCGASLSWKKEAERYIYIIDVSFCFFICIHENKVGLQHCRGPPFLKFDAFKFSEMEEHKCVLIK